jgi:pilus assembly protein FimV
MYRKSAVAAALLFITASSDIHALGLGNINMQSALNQPMNAAIELTSAAGTDLSKVTVTLASQAAHQRLGLSRSRILNDFDFTIEQDNRGNAYIKVSSNAAVHEPFLEFLLELTWPNGHLLREYTVLVDPPITMPATPPTPAAPVVSSISSPAQAIQQRRSSARPAPSTVRASTAASADSYGPIRRNETLWSIAEKLRPGRGISMHQMMLALQRKNPQAFADNNINNLNAGATLKIPTRDEILSVSASEAFAETQRQYAEWQERGQPVEPAQDTLAVADTGTDSAAAVTTESRLQLMPPETEAVDGMATAGDPVEIDGTSAEASTETLNQQLALATEEAEANKAQSAEYQSQVSELEEQVETMKRLLELKDEELASMQQQLAADADNADINSEATAPAANEAEQMEEEPTTVATAAEDEAVNTVGDESRGIVNKLMDNPLLAGLGVLVAMLLGGFLWASTRQKNRTGIFDDEMTLEKHMAKAASSVKKDNAPPVIQVKEKEPEPAQASESSHDDSDPLTEADVYLAYGRIQQAEDVLQAALATSPQDNAIRLKLLEVYHAAGNVAAFDREASDFRNGVSAEDAMWLQVASLGHALSPGNPLYQAESKHAANDGEDLDSPSTPHQEHLLDGAVNEVADSALPESIEYSLDEGSDIAAIVDVNDEEDASEGLLSTADEVTTKLDLARAYLDMGDPEGARSILGEVMEEGNDDQKNEAEALMSNLA